MSVLEERAHFDVAYNHRPVLRVQSEQACQRLKKILLWLNKCQLTLGVSSFLTAEIDTAHSVLVTDFGFRRAL